MAKKISVIITVLNESSTIEPLISALKHQTLPPSEIIVVDAVSADDTFLQLSDLSKVWKNLKVYQQPGNRSIGRNYAVKRSTGTILAFTDAGCIPDKSWLEEIVKPFSSSQVQVVSGFYQGKPANFFQKCLVPFALVMPDKAGKSEFFPSARSMAIRRSVWNKSAGFNEKLIFSEDFAYAHELKRLGFSFVFAPNAIVYWLPPENLIKSAKMFFNFALGDIRAGLFRPTVKILLIRYAVALYLFFLALQLNWVFYVLIPLVLVYLFWSISKNYRYVRDIRALFWLPVLQLTADLTVIFGTIVGFLSIKFT